MIVRNTVGPRQEAHHLDHLDARRPGIDRVRADIGPHLRPQPADAAVAVDAELGLDVLVPGLGAREQILPAIADPFHRATQLPGERRDRDLLGIERALHAEPAADIGGDHPDAVRRDPEQLGERLADHARDLGRGPEREGARAGLPLGEARSILDGDGGMPMKAEAVSHHDRRAREGRPHVALAELAAQEEIARRIVVQERTAGGHGGPWVRHRRQGRVVDADPVERVLGRVAALRRDRRHRLARVARLLRRERGHLGRRIAPHAGQRPDRPRVAPQLVTGDDGGDARGSSGGRRVDPEDPRVGVRASQERDVEHAGPHQVPHETAAPGQEPLILAALDGGADQGRRGAVFHGRARPLSGRCGGPRPRPRPP